MTARLSPLHCCFTFAAHKEDRRHFYLPRKMIGGRPGAELRLRVRRLDHYTILHPLVHITLKQSQHWIWPPSNCVYCEKIRWLSDVPVIRNTTLNNSVRCIIFFLRASSSCRVSQWWWIDMIVQPLNQRQLGPIQKISLKLENESKYSKYNCKFE